MRFSLLAVAAICVSTTLASPTLQVREANPPPPPSGDNEPFDESMSNEAGQIRRPGQMGGETSWEYRQIVDAWLMCYDHCLEKSTGSDGRINAQTRSDCVVNECGELSPGGPGLPTPTYDGDKLRPWLRRLVIQIGDGITHNLHRFNLGPATGKITMPKFMPAGARFLPSPLK